MDKVVSKDKTTSGEISMSRLCLLRMHPNISSHIISSHKKYINYGGRRRCRCLRRRRCHSRRFT